MSRFVFFIVMIGCLTPSARSDDSTPGSAPTTQPMTVDLSTPKAAVRTMFAAVAAADAPALGQAFYADTPQQHELVAAYADLVVAGRRLRDAARDKFTDENNAAPAANPAPPAASATPIGPSPEDAAQLEASEVQISGDTATLHLPDRPTPIKLRHTGDSWRIDLADYSATTPPQMSEQVEINRALAAAMDEASDEINTGKYASAQEAESAVQQKIHAVIARQLKTLPPIRPTTQSTTQSTTQPATKPGLQTAAPLSVR